ncbi:hypothetical protein KIPB_001230 [Kipferlia bialata]|uniref:Uncharacterized protein n=1 Tax=Kipferlia bialata TaxID=797122 RepID=A0A9K3CNJ5_9EUKA|nr:hypothetical protein KIPB_001230 [Kipferlia bialata]|eukprot:g1230.t1
MCWHSLASVWNIVWCLVLSKHMDISLPDLGLTPYAGDKGDPARNTSDPRRFWLRRMANVLLIVAGTHIVTPLLYWICGMVSGLLPGDYTGYSVPYVVTYYIMQQICFAVNGFDEELAWRGFMKAVWDKYPCDPDMGQSQRDIDTNPVSTDLYILTGWNYAMLHSLNVPIEGDVPGFCMMIFNLCCEGAIWMHLFRLSRDLLQNILLHDTDDLFSIWFGSQTLAGYSIPLIIVGWIVDPSKSFLSGGDFGTGASPLYIGQNLYTLGVITWLYRRREATHLESKRLIV